MVLPQKYTVVGEMSVSWRREQTPTSGPAAGVAKFAVRVASWPATAPTVSATLALIFRHWRTTAAFRLRKPISPKRIRATEQTRRPDVGQ